MLWVVPSRDHVMRGVGSPVAAHVNVSCRVFSIAVLLAGTCVKVGGTVGRGGRGEEGRGREEEGREGRGREGEVEMRGWGDEMENITGE